MDDLQQSGTILIGLAEAKKDNKALRREINLRLEAINKALELQAAEYNRRLADLNGEAGKLFSMQSTYVLEVLYRTERDEMRASINELKKFRDTMIGKQSVYMIIIPLIISITVSMALAILFHSW